MNLQKAKKSLTSQEDLLALYQSRAKDLGLRPLESYTEHELMPHFMDRAYQSFAFSLVQELLPPGQLSGTILDIGCGLGCLLPALRGIGFTGKYIGIDLVPEFAAFSRDRFPGETFLCGDILDPQVIDALKGMRIDIAIASSMFGLVSDKTFIRKVLDTAMDIAPTTLLTANSSDSRRRKPVKSTSYDPTILTSYALPQWDGVTLLRRATDSYCVFGMRVER